MFLLSFKRRMTREEVMYVTMKHSGEKTFSEKSRVLLNIFCEETLLTLSLCQEFLDSLSDFNRWQRFSYNGSSEQDILEFLSRTPDLKELEDHLSSDALLPKEKSEDFVRIIWDKKMSSSFFSDGRISGWAQTLVDLGILRKDPLIWGF